MRSTLAISSGRRICQAQSVNLAVGSAMRICQAQCRRSSGGRQLQEDRLCVVQEIIWRQVAIEGSVRRSAGGHLAAGSYMRIAQAQCRWSSGGKYKGGGRLCNPRISIRSSRGSTCRDTLEERRIYFSFIPNQNEQLAKAIPEKKQNFAWVFSKNHKKPLY